MATVYLNKDKSILCQTFGDDKFMISSTHTNKKIQKGLCQTLKK